MQLREVLATSGIYAGQPLQPPDGVFEDDDGWIYFAPGKGAGPGSPGAEIIIDGVRHRTTEVEVFGETCLRLRAEPVEG